MGKRTKLHILFWVAYILFETYLEYTWISVSFPAFSTTEHIRRSLGGEIVRCIAKFPLSYLIMYQVTLFSRNSRRLIQLFLVGVTGFIAAIVVYRLAVFYITKPYIYLSINTDTAVFGLEQNLNSLLDLLFCVMLAVTAKQFRAAQRSKELSAQIEKEQLRTELKFLRAQMNPHFLFNTLNNIYALARKKSDDTADVVMRLSKLLRFMLYESGNGRISLASAIKLLEDYINLEKIRYNNRLSVTLEKQLADEEQLIVPLLLLPFVDNAFKHGASESRFNSYIRIYIKEQEGWLYFRVDNSCENCETDTGITGIGLANVKRQLELEYPGHLLQVNKGKDVFSIELTINLHSYVNV
jgi:sensor histidine kinase YesM